MLEDFYSKQPLFCDCINQIVEKDKISHAYMFETCGVSYAFSLAVSVASYFLGKSIDVDNYPEICVIRPVNNVIKKEDILLLQERFSTKPIYGKYLIYIIDGAEYLNDSSANTLLKFLEEPSPNIIGILLTSSLDKVIDTIVSRCQVFSFVSDDFSPKAILGSFWDKNGDYDSFVSECVVTAVSFFSCYEKSGILVLRNKEFYEYKDSLEWILLLGICFYYDAMNKKINDDYVVNSDISFVNFLMDNNDLYDIIRKIEVINKFVNKFRFNVNLDMFLDSFIIAMEG